ncbi:MAG: 23S rRNA pseudouridine(2604) synthase RluF [Chitinophagaceae bacterium]|nr:23S rRNA pseudouridine(2604) synthase RluF [Chitinophagaceae bacterium]
MIINLRKLTVQNENTTSLNKFISQTGFCSRREADKLLEQCRVTVNGNIAKPGNRIMDNDEVLIDGLPLKRKVKTIYIAFNKPVGISSTTDLKDKYNIISYINHSLRIFPIGRLDKPSEGLIFLTNDGDIVNKILRAGNNHEKEYVVTVDKPITSDFIKKMGSGVNILDTVTQKCYVKQEEKFKFRIILTQGLNRQIRRMCDVLNCKVTRLVRIRIMNITLAGIPVGKWRYLTTAEIAGINKQVANSIKTEEASVLQSNNQNYD